MSKAPIGIFDSGVGGTSIWKEINRLLPNEHTIYLADSLNAPYGIKSKSKIIQLAVKNTDLLLAKGCKLVVVACNTATTNAIAILRKNYNCPFIGIEPAIKPAALQTATNAIGILATKGTLSSALFSQTSERFASHITIVEQVGEGIVELIENGKLYAPEMKTLLMEYVTPMLEQNIDHLVLGCTHYPYLLPILKDILPTSIKIIDSGAAVAKQTKTVLQQNNLLNTNLTKGLNEFHTNGNHTVMQTLIGHKYDITTLVF